MISVDVNRLKRNHVKTVRARKDKFYVIVNIIDNGIDDNIEVEVEWDRWINMSDADKQRL